ncbi:hypothetical protein BDA99DRAFT_610197 [Phascolomyces articulosus]|uniref:Uncharacterized protein n=1 Tax=Phascolomyces articulosus TaxID=60185 RepID=A0AAD5JXJ8_9FUNG|nr:hypothetical protein BDA99DRAFT_610197 [Phascolomyces articulosus]
MTDLAPYVADGYPRLVFIYSMYGRQQDDIEVFEEGLVRLLAMMTKISSSNSSEQQQEVENCSFAETRTNITLFSTALSNIRDTLTSLEINIGNNASTIHLSEILLSCDILLYLIYITVISIESTFGDFSIVEDNHPLWNLQIRATSIRGQDTDRTYTQKMSTVTLIGG